MTRQKMYDRLKRDGHNPIISYQTGNVYITIHGQEKRFTSVTAAYNHVYQKVY